MAGKMSELEIHSALDKRAKGRLKSRSQTGPNDLKRCLDGWDVVVVVVVVVAAAAAAATTTTAGLSFTRPKLELCLLIAPPPPRHHHDQRRASIKLESIK